MAETVTVSIDAMGGDHGPSVTLAGAEAALRRNPGIRYILYGEEQAIRAELRGRPELAAVSAVIDCEVSVRMDDKPSQALRKGRRKSSMWRAIEAVKHGEAAFTVSAGNTGALMVMARVCLGTMPNIDRAALAGLWPTMTGESVVLDLGASIGADANNLVDCAVMGGAMARVLFQKPRPTVGLLNVGVEEMKGLEAVREAGRMLREANPLHIDYVGFVEGNDLGKGTVDVVVTEGFAGNIALKTAEGTARQIASYLREEMRATLRARLGYLLARPAFQSLRVKLDPGRANGGVFLGLAGVVIKSHGGTDAAGFAQAIIQGLTMVRNGLLAKIGEDLAVFHPPAQPAPAAAAAGAA